MDSLAEPPAIRAIDFKFHACCHGTHSPIESARALRQQLEFGVAEIVDVEVRMPAVFEDVCCIENSTSALEGKFSVRYTECAMIGLAHADLGEAVAAAVILDSSADPVTTEELRVYAAARLAHYEVPSLWWLRVDPLPTTETGKLHKRLCGSSGRRGCARDRPCAEARRVGGLEGARRFGRRDDCLNPGALGS